MAVSVRLAPPPAFAENLFFKSFPEVVLGSPLPGLREKSTQCLECSSKFGVLIVAGQETLLILRADDVITSQTNAKNNYKKQVELGDIPHIRVDNRSLGTAPTCIAISHGEEFIAVDTQKNGIAFVLVFKLEQFLLQSGGSSPFCEIRGSTTEGSRVSGIAWNPGENMGGMFAIICNDGSLQLASVKGQNSVEICSLRDGNAKSMCWSPKGKQLVIGRNNGNLSQLKLDLTEAKQIPGPGGGRTPSAVFWSSTTQFLINFIVEERDIDFMQLDLAKGAPPVYSSFGDVFVSDLVSSESKCFFVPIIPWNIAICPTNTINDILVMSKGLQQGMESWTTSDIDDTRRAAIPIDSFAVGAALFIGWEAPVILSDTESYGPMPVLFTLSDAGALCSAFVINKDASIACINQKVPNPLPSALFTPKSNAPKIATTVPPFVAPVVQNIKTAATESPQLAALLGNPDVSQVASRFQSPFDTQKPTSKIEAPNLGTTKSSPFSQNSFTSGSRGLPTPQQVEELKKIIEERRDQGVREADSDGYDYDALSMDFEKFQIRMGNFKSKQDDLRQKITMRLDGVCKKFEQEVLVALNILEDFTGAIEETTKCQKDEVHQLKERILSHFTQLEYAKSLAERNKDPKYIQLLRAQSMDPSTLQRLQNVEKKFQYVKNQVNECDRFFQIQSRESRPLDGAAAATQVIYQTLSNHSKIIKRLVQDLNGIRSKAGLSKCADLDDDMDVFQFPSLGYFEKKTASKTRVSNQDQISENIASNRITLDDLTAGISRVKLQKGSEFMGSNSKPVKISAKKLQVLREAMTEIVEIKVPSSSPELFLDPFKISSQSKTDTKTLIKMLDDKTLPPQSIKINEKGDGFSTHSASKISTIPDPQIRASNTINKINPTISPSTISSRTPPTTTSSQPIMFGVSPTNIFQPKSYEENQTKQVEDKRIPTFGSSGIFNSFGTTSTSFSSPLNISGNLLGNASSQSSLLGAPPVLSNTLIKTSPASSASILSFSQTSVSSYSTLSAPNSLASSTPPSLSTTSSSNSSNDTPVSSKVQPSSSADKTTRNSPQSQSSLFNPSMPITLTQKPVGESAATTANITPQRNIFGGIALGSSSSGLSNTEPTGLSELGAVKIEQKDSILPLPVVSTASVKTTSAATNITPQRNIFGGIAVGSSGLPTTESTGLSELGAAKTQNKDSVLPLPVVSAASASSASTTSASGSSSVFGGTSGFGSLSSGSTFGLGSLGSLPTNTSVAESTEGGGKAPQSTVSSGTPVNSNLSAGGLGSTGGIFGGSATFGSGSVFGASSFGASPSNPQPGLFSPVSAGISQTGAGVGVTAAKPGAFESAPVFGGTPAFGSTSPFGSAFGSPGGLTPSVGFGGSGSGSSIFGGANSQQSGATFGALAQTATPQSTFGGFGSSNLTQSSPFGQTQSSPFGQTQAPQHPQQASAFGQAASPASSVFGGGSFGAASSNPQPGLFGAASTGISQPGQVATGIKPGGFGSAPVFGGTPAFGSTSPFGSAFGSPGGLAPSVGFGGSSSGSSIFGGANSQQSAPTFGALAQTAAPQSTFGGFGSSNLTQSSPFGQTQSSPFGQTQAQQQPQQASAFGQAASPASSSFGGSAFSSWR